MYVTATGLELTTAWVFVYEQSGFGFESRCSHLKFRFGACFEQGVPWHSGNYRVWIQSETRMWHDKNIQLFKYMVWKSNCNIERTMKLTFEFCLTMERYSEYRYFSLGKWAKRITWENSIPVN